MTIPADLLRSALTPAERQLVLRRLKRGPALPRRELAEYARKVREEVVARRTVNKATLEKESEQ